MVAERPGLRQLRKHLMFHEKIKDAPKNVNLKAERKLSGTFIIKAQ